MSLFLINPSGGKRRMAKKRRTAAQRRATAKMIAANRKRRRVGTRKRRRTKARRTSAPRVVVINPGGGKMARRKRSRSAPRRRRRVARARVRRNPPRRRARVRRRSFRRNPGGRQPVLKIITTGFVAGLAGLGGSVAVKKLAAAIPAPKDAAGAVNPYVQSLIDLVVGAGVSFAATKFRLPTNVAASVTTGAMMATYERVLKRHAPQIATPLLGEDRYYGLTPGGGIPGEYGTGVYPQAFARALPGNNGIPDMGMYPGSGVESEDFTF